MRGPLEAASVSGCGPTQFHSPLAHMSLELLLQALLPESWVKLTVTCSRGAWPDPAGLEWSKTQHASYSSDIPVSAALLPFLLLHGPLVAAYGSAE